MIFLIFCLLGVFFGGGGYNLKMSSPDSDIYAEIPEDIPDSSGKYGSTNKLGS